jgi:YD repeat-containing protein
MTASRLTALIYRNALGPLGDLTYQYDTAGNRTRVGGSLARTDLPQPMVSATYNASNQQITFAGQALNFDLNGNLTSDGSTAYTWDARNRLTSVTGPGMTTTFQYDLLGRRAQKTINGIRTSFLYDGKNPLHELSDTTLRNLLGSIDRQLRRADQVLCAAPPKLGVVDRHATLRRAGARCGRRSGGMA